MSNNKKSGGLFGKGYYIALILCAAAIGISGYVYYRNASRTEEVLQQNETGVQVAVVATEEDIPALLSEGFDYVVDAIDTVRTKLALAQYCEAEQLALISSMGTGNKTDPTKFEIADIYKTSVCPLARAVRTQLKKRGVKHLKVLYSKELPDAKGEMTERGPASCSFVPSVAGLIIASEVIKDLIR